MDNNKWYNSLSEEQKTAYRERHNKQLRERYASDAARRLQVKEDSYLHYGKKRDAVIIHLGGRCSSPTCSWVCADGQRGCDVRPCLQIDHVHGDGAKRRKAGEKGTAFYTKVLASLPGVDYQLLCANCNWIKRHVNRELPQARHAVAGGSYGFTPNN